MAERHCNGRGEKEDDIKMRVCTPKIDNFNHIMFVFVLIYQKEQVLNEGGDMGKNFYRNFSFKRAKFVTNSHSKSHTIMSDVMIQALTLSN